jgi:PilZ domain
MEKPGGMLVVPEVPLAHRIDERGKSDQERKNQYPVTSAPTITEARCQPRFTIEVDITINSPTCGVLKGHSVDLSESWIAAMLSIEVPLGENVDLSFTLPSGPVTIHAIVREKNAFRYGFEFVDSDSMHELIRRTCRDLAVDQALSLVYFTAVVG